MHIKISDSETGSEQEWDIPDWLAIIVLSGIVTGILLLAF